MSRAALAVAVVLAGASPARADSRAEAIALFDQGIKDMRAGRLDKACPALKASLDLVKDSGTKGALARCHGLAGRLATAWLLWRELADTAPTAELRADAAAQAARLEPRLPRYTIRIASGASRPTVQINGRTVAAAVPVAVPIDPGKVMVTATVGDGDRAVTETWAREYVAVEGETLAIDIPGLEVKRDEAAQAVAPAPVEAPPPADPGRTRRVIAFVLGGVALGAAGGGAAFGLDARARYGDAKALCGGVIKQCDPAQLASSQSRVDRARTSAMRSNILFGAAGAAAAAAVIVWITAPSAERTPVSLVPAASPDLVGLALGGAF